MNKNHYQLLGVDRGASQAEIERAYAQKALEFPAEGNPAEFRLEKIAYKTLSDPQSRAQYDSLLELPEGDEILELAATLENSGVAAQRRRAVARMEEISQNHPGESLYLYLLAVFYSHEGAVGKAIRALEAALRLEPEDPRIHRALADAYRARNWNKKAISMYQKLIQEDADDAETWCFYLACFEDSMYDLMHSDIMEQAEQRAKEKRFRSIMLYWLLFTVGASVNGGVPDEAHLDKILELVRTKEYDADPERLEQEIRMITSMVAHPLFFKYAPVVEEIVSLSGVTSDAIDKDLAHIRLCYRFEEMASGNYSDILKALIRLLTLGRQGGKESTSYQPILESTLLDDVDDTRRELLRLREAYPELYRLDEEFFNQVVEGKNIKSLIRKYEKEAEKLYPQLLRMAFSASFLTGEALSLPGEEDQVGGQAQKMFENL